MRIIFTGGGTAGHIFPIAAIIDEIKRNHPLESFEFFYVGPKDDFAKEIFNKKGVVVKTIITGKIRRYFSIENIIDILKFPIGIFQAFYYVFVISPDLIFSKGGYGSVPTVICGWLLNVPIFLHESDITPGLANRIASKFALEIFISFSVEKTEYFPTKKVLSVGCPIRSEILNGNKDEAKKIFNLTEEKPVILVLGGSQGAQKINDNLLIILAEILKDFEIIHQTGKNNFEQVKKESEVVLTKELKKYYHPIGFLNEKELSCAYAAANLIISRAGASAIFEIAGVKKPSILIPLSGSAQNHQIKNAYAFGENGAAIVIEEINFKPHFFLERVKYLLSQPFILNKMAKKAEEFSRPYSSKIIAEYIVAYLKQ